MDINKLAGIWFLLLGFIFFVLKRPLGEQMQKVYYKLFRAQYNLKFCEYLLMAIGLAFMVFGVLEIF